jgi:hypothetical protein
VADDNRCDTSVAKALHRLPQLDTLRLKSPAILSKTVEVIPQLTFLKSLSLNNPSTPSLVAVLPQLRLVQLVLSEVQLGQHSSSFCSGLAGLSQTLAFLSLSSIIGLSFADFSQVLPELKYLDILSLGYCDFVTLLDAASVRPFMTALSQLQLAELCLQEFVSSTQVLEEIVSSLPLLTSLQRLELVDCVLDALESTDKVWSDCFKAMAKCSKLNSFLATSLPPFTCDLLTLLPNTHLTTLSLPAPDFTDQEQEALLDTLGEDCEISFY